MYILTHDGDNIGTSNLERGDPAACSVSGIFNNVGGAKPLAAWMKSVGGKEDNGVVFIELNDEYCLQDREGQVVKLKEGHLIAVPEQDEAFLDIITLDAEEYKLHFSQLISALNNQE